MAKIIVNAAMVPNAGTFAYRNISVGAATVWLQAYGDVAVSYVGYAQTADHIQAISGVRVATNRAKTRMTVGDEALVVKLAYRVADPATKGQAQPEDWEYGLLKRER